MQGDESFFQSGVIAQLVAIREDLNSSGSSESTDKIVEAINAIKITTDKISVEAGSLNLNTDEVETLIRNLNPILTKIKEALYEYSYGGSNPGESLYDKVNRLNSVIGPYSDENGNTLLGRLCALGDVIGDTKGMFDVSYKPTITIFSLLNKVIFELNLIKNFNEVHKTEIVTAINTQGDKIVAAIQALSITK